MRSRIRRIALYGAIAFILGSTLLHFTIGSTVAMLYPTWRYPAMPDQAISIISLSQVIRELKTPPPTPEPTPRIIVRRTSLNLAMIRHREIGSRDTSRVTVHPPARKAAKRIVKGPELSRPGTTDATAATNVAQPTASPIPNAGSRADTGGNADELNGASVWGDNNPPRVVHLEPIASVPSQTVRIAVDVGPDGQVLGLKLLQSSGDPNLDQLALDAARKTIFAPATLNGLPVHGTFILEYPAANAARTT